MRLFITQSGGGLGWLMCKVQGLQSHGCGMMRFMVAVASHNVAKFSRIGLASRSAKFSVVPQVWNFCRDALLDTNASPMT